MRRWNLVFGVSVFILFITLFWSELPRILKVPIVQHTVALLSDAFIFEDEFEFTRQYQHELLSIALDIGADSIQNPYYIFIGLTNPDESRPGGGLLVGYALIEVSDFKYRVINVAANESFGRKSIDGFESYWPTFGPSVATFFDSTLVPDIDVTSKIVARHIESQIFLTPDLFVYIESDDFLGLLNNQETSDWLEFDQYSVGTSARNEKTRKILSGLDLDLTAKNLFRAYPRLSSTGALRITNLEDISIDTLNYRKYPPETLVIYQTNPAGNKLDRYIEIETEICRKERILEITHTLTYKPPEQVWGYQVGMADTLEKVTSPTTETTLFTLGDFKTPHTKSKNSIRIGQFDQRSWQTLRYSLSPKQEISDSYQVFGENLKNYLDLTSSAKMRSRTVSPIGLCTS